MNARLLLSVFVLLLSLTVVGQQNNPVQDEQFATVFGNQQADLGGYVSLGFGNTIINDNNALFGQFRLAARLGHSFSIGIAGAGFSDWLYGLNHDRPDMSPDGYFIEGGYGGILLEPVFAPNFPVHLSFPVLIGAGGVALSEETEKYDWDDFEYETGHFVLASDAFLVIEPGIELEFNLSRYVRMGAGISYRFTNAIDIEGSREYLLNGLSGSVNLKLGVF